MDFEQGCSYVAEAMDGRERCPTFIKWQDTANLTHALSKKKPRN